VGNEPLRVGLSQLLDFLQKRGIDIAHVAARAVGSAVGAGNGVPTQPAIVEGLPTEVAPAASQPAPPARRADPQPQDQDGPATHEPDAHATHGQDGRATENHGTGAHAAAGVEGVAQLAQAVIADAVAKGASAIHVESRRGGSLILRYRIDGLLHDKTNFTSRLPNSAAWGLLVHLGQMAGMDLAKSQLPATGQFSVAIDGRQVDFHASSCPLAIDMRSGTPRPYGRPMVALVIDILDAKPAAGFEQMAPTAAREKLSRVLQADGGLVIVAGMPKSGKNAILQAMLAELVAQPSRKGYGFAAIQNAPWPAIDGVRHVQVQPEHGFTFTKATDAIRRQDCDVVLVGDVRDPHCASACLEMALQGRMVLVGMTARHGAGAMAMLEMMDLEPWPLASALSAVVASARLPRLCEHCKVKLEPRERDSWLRQLGLSVTGEFPLFGAGSCSRCSQLGYSGKVNLLGVAQCGGEIAASIRNQAWAELKQGGVPAMADADLKALALECLRAGQVTPAAAAGIAGLY
jgi:type II secretory ATPase GspE/PulE/Tfp pilus assembly ATPase PilB-like protein